MSQHLIQLLDGCIDDCLSCHISCLTHAAGRGLELGGRHVDPEHFRLMLDCAEICQTAANFMMRSSRNYRNICLICAKICKACAASCQDVGGMQECVEACWRCAASCDDMAAEED